MKLRSAARVDFPLVAGMLLTALVIAGTGARATRALPAGAPPAGRVDANVIYGTYSGLALLMDVHYPIEPNGYGILLVPGTGWTGSTEMNARSPKDERAQVGLLAPPLLAAGYTVFIPNHRLAPRFHFPAPFEDVARAVRFIRLHAADYKLHPQRLAGVGYSSGANLVALLGVRSDDTPQAGADPVAGESARLQCVVAGGTPADLTNETTPEGYAILSGYLGVTVSANTAKDSEAFKRLVEASPLTYVTPDDAPILFFNGSEDRLVPTANARRMSDALIRAGVRSRLIEINGAAHWPLTEKSVPELTDAIVAWLGECLRPPPSR